MNDVGLRALAERKQRFAREGDARLQPACRAFHSVALIRGADSAEPSAPAGDLQEEPVQQKKKNHFQVAAKNRKKMALTSDQQPPCRTRRPKLVLGNAGVAGGVPPADVCDRQRPVGQQRDPEGGEAKEKTDTV